LCRTGLNYVDVTLAGAWTHHERSLTKNKKMKATNAFMGFNLHVPAALFGKGPGIQDHRPDTKEGRLVRKISKAGCVEGTPVTIIITSTTKICDVSDRAKGLKPVYSAVRIIPEMDSRLK